MRHDGRVILALFAALALLCAAAGLDWLKHLIEMIANWLRAWPAPTKAFADMIGALGWPIAVLAIVWLIRRPLRRAAYLLAERMKSDDFEIPGFLKINSAPITALDGQHAAEHLNVQNVNQDANITESLLEFAGQSEQNANQLLSWIVLHLGSTMDPEEFVSEPSFANQRHQAYIDLIGDAA